MVREYTEKFWDLCDEGLLEWKSVAEMCFKYMSEDDIQDMWEANCMDDIQDMCDEGF